MGESKSEGSERDTKEHTRGSKREKKRGGSRERGEKRERGERREREIKKSI